MGIDKSMHEDSPIVIIDGTVYQYGKLPDEIMWTDEKRERDTWSIEHHSYAKEYFLFYSEQEMQDFIDGLPESAHPPFKVALEPFHTRDQWGNISVTDRQGWDAELERHREQIRQWRRELADRKRVEKAKAPLLSPAQRFAKESRAAIDAVLDQHLTHPWEDWDDPEIERQISLILAHYLRKYHKAAPTTKPSREGSEDIPF